MSNTFAPDEFPCELLVNGVSIQSVRIRQGAESAGDLAVVITDPVVGCFTLHSGFDIDVQEPDSTSWRRVSFEELKKILKDKNLLASESLPNSSQMAECRLFARVDDIEIPQWRLAGFLCWGGRKHVFDIFSASCIEQEFRTWSLARLSPFRVP